MSAWGYVEQGSGSPRYPEIQDGREVGLSLLRAQYEAVELNVNLAWTDQNPPVKGAVEIIGCPGVKVILTGDAEKMTDLATLICRAVKFGWHMLNELEPGTANETPGSEPSPAGGKEG